MRGALPRIGSAVSRSGPGRFAVCAAALFVAETSLMVLLPVLMPGGGWVAVVADGALLMFLCGPVVAWAVRAGVSVAPGVEGPGESDGSSAATPDRRLRRTAWVAMASIAGLAALGAVTLLGHLADVAHDPRTVNNVARQRMFAERLAWAAAGLADGGAPDAAEAARVDAALGGFQACGADVERMVAALRSEGLRPDESLLTLRVDLAVAARGLLAGDARTRRAAAAGVSRLEPAVVAATDALLALAERDAALDMARLQRAVGALLVVKLALLAALGLAGIEPAARALRRSVAEADRLAEVAGRTDNGVVITDAQGRIEWCNEGFTRLTGYTLEEVRGRTPGSVLQGPGTDPAAVARMRDAVRAGRAFTEQVLNYAKDGTAHHLLIDTRPVLDASGRLAGFMALQSDVTARVGLEHALRTERERLRVAAASVGAGVWDFDPATGALIWDAAMFRIYGLDPSSPVTYSVWRAAIAAEDVDEAETRLQEAILGGRPFHVVFRVRLATGEVRWVSGDATVVRDDRGRPVRVVGVNIDVTERVLAERREREFGEQVRRITAGVPGVVHQFRMRPDGRCSFPYVSDGIREVYRLEPSDVVEDASRVFELVHPEDAGALRESVERSAREMSRWSHDYRVRFAGGEERWLHGESVPRKEPDGSIVWTGFVTDVTDRVEAGRELERAKERAEEASRAKSQFLANMSHEIRTPMTAIVGYADLLADAPDRVALAEYARTIKRNGEHLLAVINDILDLSKIEAGRATLELSPAPVVALVDEVVSLLGVQAAGKGIVLEREFETPVPERVVTDPVRLRQVLMNLVGNAVKFTELGGVRLLVGYEAAAPGGARLRFAVADTGVGIAPEAMAGLFQPFTQASGGMTRKYGGTGLGLSISRRLAQMLGGDIACESEPGRGSTFTLTVSAPIAAGAGLVDPWSAPAGNEPAAGPAPAPAQGAPLAGLRVLLAEDGPDNRRLIAHLLRKSGAAVTTAENGREALALLCAGDPEGRPAEPAPFDLVVMDMQMPEVDGYTATRTLRGRGSALPVLALTAHAMAGDRDACLAAGCDDYATKPIQREALVEACVRMTGARAAGGRPAPEAAAA